MIVIEERVHRPCVKRDEVSQIFINYRREGGAYAAALLDELLGHRFGEGRIFRAARSIGPGEDYAKALLKAVAECSVMLVIVDEGWVAKFASGVGDPSFDRDWVHREIQEAFRNGRTVVPVLLSGVSRLDEGSLPESLSAVARLQYLRFDYRNTHQDVNSIAEGIVKACPRILNDRGVSSLPFGWLRNATGFFRRNRS
ncbi:toll/interleukin-1 receptor domain-containing protein [Streptomyces sp. NPDC004684]